MGDKLATQKYTSAYAYVEEREGSERLIYRRAIAAVFTRCSSRGAGLGDKIHGLWGPR